MHGDLIWLFHRLRLSLGLVGPVSKVAILRSSQISTLLSTHSGKGKPKKLVVFSHNLGQEGASISLKELVCGLQQRGAVIPNVVAFGDGVLEGAYKSRGIPVHILPSILHKISTLGRLDNEVNYLASIMRKSGAEVAFVNTLLNFPAILAAERAGIPSVWNIRESEAWSRYFCFLPDAVARQAIAAIGLPRSVVFVAESTRAMWKEFEHLGNFIVIHNSLDRSRFAKYLSYDRSVIRRDFGWSDTEIVFLCVGTVCERKGQEDALRAIEQIMDRLAVPIRLIFAGDVSGSYAHRQQRSAQLICNKCDSKIHIDFIGATEDIGRYYRAADIFLLCSRIESYPRAILEAMTFGLPIISTPVFGIAEQIPDTEDARLYEPGDIAKLGEFFMEMINNPVARQRLGDRARARVLQMPSFDQMVEKYEHTLLLASHY